MNRPALVFTLIAFFLSVASARAAPEKAPPPPHFDYEAARAHEIKPHRRTIPTEGAQAGFNQLHLTLTISPSGDVLSAEAGNDKTSTDFWPKVRDEVYAWKFTPFESNGHLIAAEIEEYVDLVPPELLPKTHIHPPPLHPNSSIVITLRRSGCYGTCPSYSATLANSGVLFEGGGYVVASGKHAASIDMDALRALAQKFLKADFYSMNGEYTASVTDCPTYQLSISIDGRTKAITDYMGSWVGMPAIIEELEENVDELAQTSRWIKGSDGLVSALQADHYNFKTYDAQVLLKEAAQRGQSATVKDLLEAGVPLKPIPAPRPKEPYEVPAFQHVGWLTAASSDAKTLQLLIDAQLSHDDQPDKDLALINAASSGNLDSVRALINYGANPNADLNKLTITHESAGMTMEGPGPGSILIYAAGSGNPDVVREILQYHPQLEARDREGKTALFVVGDGNGGESGPAECIRLLVQAGANLNAHDHDGNTALHEMIGSGIVEELLKLGANVNARNNNGETPIFTTYDEKTIPLFLKYGADLNIRNNKGHTVLEAASTHGPLRIKALKKAIEAQSRSTANPASTQPQ